MIAPIVNNIQKVRLMLTISKYKPRKAVLPLKIKKGGKVGFPLLCQIPLWCVFSAKMQGGHLFVLIILCSRYEAVKTQGVLEIQIYILQLLTDFICNPFN